MECGLNGSYGYGYGCSRLHSYSHQWFINISGSPVHCFQWKTVQAAHNGLNLRGSKAREWQEDLGGKKISVKHQD